MSYIRVSGDNGKKIRRNTTSSKPSSGKLFSDGAAVSDYVSTVRDARFAKYFFYLKPFADCEQLMIYSHGQNVLTVYVL